MVQTELEEAGFTITPLRKMLVKNQDDMHRSHVEEEHICEKRSLLKNEITRWVIAC